MGIERRALKGGRLRSGAYDEGGQRLELEFVDGGTLQHAFQGSHGLHPEHDVQPGRVGDAVANGGSRLRFLLIMLQHIHPALLLLRLRRRIVEAIHEIIAILLKVL